MKILFGLSSPAEYAKELINTQNQDKNKEYVAEAKYKIRFRRRIKQMNDKEKKYKNANETSEIINEIIDYNNNTQNFFIVRQKLIKKYQNQRLKKVLPREQN